MDYEAKAFELGYVKYKEGQEVIPPDYESEWYYHKDSPDGDWFNTAKECVENG